MTTPSLPQHPTASLAGGLDESHPLIEKKD